MYKLFPDSRRALLKTGGNFPYLRRSDEVNTFIQVGRFYWELSTQRQNVRLVLGMVQPLQVRECRIIVRVAIDTLCKQLRFNHPLIQGQGLMLISFVRFFHRLPYEAYAC